MKNPRINESLIIGVDFSNRDDGVLIVVRQKNGEVTIINAFQGKEAFDIKDEIEKQLYKELYSHLGLQFGG